MSQVVDDVLQTFATFARDLQRLQLDVDHHEQLRATGCSEAVSELLILDSLLFQAHSHLQRCRDLLGPPRDQK